LGEQLVVVLKQAKGEGLLREIKGGEVRARDRGEM
jgi:hypothetical protein